MQLLEVKPARGEGYHIQTADGKKRGDEGGRGTKGMYVQPSFVGK